MLYRDFVRTISPYSLPTPSKQSQLPSSEVFQIAGISFLEAVV